MSDANGPQLHLRRLNPHPRLTAGKLYKVLEIEGDTHTVMCDDGREWFAFSKEAWVWVWVWPDGTELPATE